MLTEILLGGGLIAAAKAAKSQKGGLRIDATKGGNMYCVFSGSKKGGFEDFAVSYISNNLKDAMAWMETAARATLKITGADYISSTKDNDNLYAVRSIDCGDKGAFYYAVMMV